MEGLDRRGLGVFTDNEVMKELKSNSAFNKARQKFSSWSAKIEQAGQQRRPLTAIEMRRMEFEAVKEIIETYSGHKVAHDFGE